MIDSFLSLPAYACLHAALTEVLHNTRLFATGHNKKYKDNYCSWDTKRLLNKGLPYEAWQISPDLLS